MEQAGLYKINLYENKGVSVTYDSEKDISSLTNSGEVLDFETNLNKNKFSDNLSSANNNLLLNEYVIGIELNGIASAMELLEKLNNSIYGWIPVFEFMDGQKKTILTPFFQNAPEVNTSVSHTFKGEMKPRKLAAIELIDII
ncbi:MAG: hypothetical protein GY870_21410 [archaeon]|nr:hypothetical protein [archaeon]